MDPQMTRAQAAGFKRFSARAAAAAAAAAAAVGGGAAAPSASGGAAAAINHLRSLGVRMEAGLSEDELERIEASFNMAFPADLRCILREGLPVGTCGGFPDWRSGGAAALRLWIDAPKSSLLAAAERGDFWWKSWGSSPPLPSAATAVAARAALRRAPMLIPVYDRCYVAAAGGGGGGGVSPVIFIDQATAYYCAATVSELFFKDAFVKHLKSALPPPYIPDSISIASSAAADSAVAAAAARRLIARCESNLGQSSRRKIDQGGGGGGGGGGGVYEEGGSGAGILSHGWCIGSTSLRRDVLDERKSSREVVVDDRKSSSVSSSRISSSMRSSCCDDELRIDASFSSLDSASSSISCSSSVSAASRSRRIDFWSDLVERRDKLNIAPGRDKIEKQQQQGRHQAEAELPQDCSSLVDRVVQDMSTKLRNAGWNEAEIAEICSSSTKMVKDDRGAAAAADVLPDRQAVIQNLALHLDVLSSCLRNAGWSRHDVAETLCFDDMSGFSSQRRRPDRLNIPADVEARISILAAFVAQG